MTKITDFFDRHRSFRKGPLKEGAFKSPLHSERLAAWLGLALGISFLVSFATGLVSHLIQKPPDWFLWPSRPLNLYRIIQGVHVATGIASIPLLLAKLWTVFPRLFLWPPVESVAHGLERLSLLPLVGGSVFLLMSGVLNIASWYPWMFFFPSAHYWAAWITMGALVVHIGAKFSITAAALKRAGAVSVGAEGLSRRAFLAAVAGAAGVLTLVTLGQTVKGLRRVGFLAPRDPTKGPQGFPVNKTAVSARVTETAVNPDWKLSVEGAVSRPLTLSLEELHDFPQHEVALPIACVEGWSASATWKGVRLRDLLAAAGAEKNAAVAAESLQQGGLYRRSEINRLHAADLDTLVALEVNGEPLHIDHGFPARLIGPNRPGVMQTKWLARLVVQ